MNISPEIINEIFDFSNNSAYEISCGNCLSLLNILHILRSSPLQVLLLKYVIKYLTKSKKQPPLQSLKEELKTWIHRVAHIDFAKHLEVEKWLQGEVASMDLLIFIGNPNVTFF